MCSRKAALEWYQNNKEQSFANTKRYREADPQKNREASMRWYNKNKERVYNNNRQWTLLHPEKITQYAIKRYSTPKGRLSRNISCYLRQSIRQGKQGAHWENIVGYDVNKLRSHLEKQFLPDMSWDNYGSHWHIDHKIPISAFNYNNYNDFDFKRCWGLKNLRPLWKKENLMKYNKLEKPFQPMFAMGG